MNALLTCCGVVISIKWPLVLSYSLLVYAHWKYSQKSCSILPFVQIFAMSVTHPVKGKTAIVTGAGSGKISQTINDGIYINSEST